MVKIACLGAAHYDEKLKSIHPIRPKSSNPVRSLRSFGGVIRNVAENLARLGVKVKLISRVGDDDRGKRLIQEMQAIGIDVDEIRLSELSATGTYTAILDADGELFVSAADMQIYDEMTPTMLSEIRQKIQECPYWIADAAFSEECLYYLAKERPAGIEFWAMATSLAKVVRWKRALPFVDVLFLNQAELRVLAKDARDLLALGVKKVVVTQGEGGLYAVTHEKEISLPAFPAQVVDVTGVGDALAASVLFGVSQGVSFEKSLVLGLRSAQLTIESAYTVLPTMAPEVLMSQI
jgi:pseudouridine kinase